MEEDEWVDKEFKSFRDKSLEEANHSMIDAADACAYLPNDAFLFVTCSTVWLKRKAFPDPEGFSTLMTIVVLLCPIRC